MTFENSASYFLHTRVEIEPLLPKEASSILEIGCGSGATLRWLKDRWPSARTVGVDGFEPALAQIRDNADEAIIVNLDEGLPELGSFDLILALDVLEHLKDPQKVLGDLVKHLTPNGTVIVSVPNVAHVSVLTDLVFRRRFTYRDAGILDRTHLRFFTEESATQLLRDAGLEIEGGLISGLEGKKTSFLNTLTFGIFKHYFVKQYIMAGSLNGTARPYAWLHSKRVDKAGRHHQ